MNTYEGELLNKMYMCKKKELKYSIKRNYKNERIKIHTDKDITTPLVHK